MSNIDLVFARLAKLRDDKTKLTTQAAEIIQRQKKTDDAIEKEMAELSKLMGGKVSVAMSKALPRRRRRATSGKMNAEKMAQAQAMLDGGEKLQDIADACGVTLPTINYHLKQMNLVRIRNV